MGDPGQSILTFPCPGCHTAVRVPFRPLSALICPVCASPAGNMGEEGTVFESCPVCRCRQFYVQKDFNRAAGCLIMVVGILLVPMTYGLSLVVFAAVDAMLYRCVPAMAICYRCRTEYRNFPIPQRLKPFLHHIAMKYEKADGQ
jgi:hypothetical protein